ncbi:hypothetical protein AKO1_007616 [Acrasis kona]|uniref:Uncharacterized protein n=1 Tax=Acrasis kona TaxID=1008807 RepID=A0AAW2YP79_9EUKA
MHTMSSMHTPRHSSLWVSQEISLEQMLRECNVSYDNEVVVDQEVQKITPEFTLAQSQRLKNDIAALQRKYNQTMCESRKKDLIKEEINVEKDRIRRSVCDEGIRRLSSGMNDTMVYGISHKGNFFHRKNDKWEQIDLNGIHVRDVCVTKRGEVYVVDIVGNVFQYKGSTLKDLNISNSSSYRIIKIKVIKSKALLKTKIYALSDDGTPLFLNNSGKNNHWQEVGSQKLKEFSVGVRKFDGVASLWGINFKDRPMYFEYKLQMWVTADSIARVRDISVSRGNTVFAIRKYDNKLVTFNGETFTECGNDHRFSTICANNGEDVIGVPSKGDGLDVVKVNCLSKSTGIKRRMTM